jgi:hypothetical protein
VTQACAENSFAISNSIRHQANDPLIHGVFLLHWRFNHSCIPNSKVPITGKEIIASFATRDIVAREEITFCYNTDFERRTRLECHQALRFVCDCKACLTDTPFQQFSDMRRTLIRGLQYLTLGVDLNGQRQGSASPIIVDSKLKKTAEDFSIPLSARLIYNLLSCLYWKRRDYWPISWSKDSIQAYYKQRPCFRQEAAPESPWHKKPGKRSFV